MRLTILATKQVPKQQLTVFDDSAAFGTSLFSDLGHEIVTTSPDRTVIMTPNLDRRAQMVCRTMEQALRLGAPMLGVMYDTGIRISHRDYWLGLKGRAHYQAGAQHPTYKEETAALARIWDEGLVSRNQAVFGDGMSVRNTTVTEVKRNMTLPAFSLGCWLMLKEFARVQPMPSTVRPRAFVYVGTCKTHRLPILLRCVPEDVVVNAYGHRPLWTVRLKEIQVRHKLYVHTKVSTDQMYELNAYNVLTPVVGDPELSSVGWVYGRPIDAVLASSPFVFVKGALVGRQFGVWQLPDEPEFLEYSPEQVCELWKEFVCNPSLRHRWVRRQREFIAAQSMAVTLASLGRQLKEAGC